MIGRDDIGPAHARIPDGLGRFGVAAAEDVGKPAEKAAECCKEKLAQAVWNA